MGQANIKRTRREKKINERKKPESPGIQEEGTDKKAD